LGFLACLEPVTHAKLEIGQHTTKTHRVTDVACKVSGSSDGRSARMQGTNVKTDLDAFNRLCANADTEVADGVVLISDVVRVVGISLIGQCAFDSTNADARVDSKPIGTFEWAVVEEKPNPVGFTSSVKSDTTYFRAHRIVARKGTEANEQARFLRQVVGEVE